MLNKTIIFKWTKIKLEIETTEQKWRSQYGYVDLHL